MKEYFKYFLILFIFFQVYACDFVTNHKLPVSPESSLKTKIGFSTKVIDLGSLTNDTTVEAVFYIKNIGETDLIIKKIEPECGCTGYILDNDTILSGDSTRLLIKFCTKGKEAGLVKTVINIWSNSLKEYNSLFLICRIIP